MNKTIADIVAEMRSLANEQEKIGFYDLRCVVTKTLRVFADRIEAAMKREVAVSKTETTTPTCKESLQVGDMAAMFNALKQIDRIVWDKRRHTKEEVEAHRLATEALSTPARNCDRFDNCEDAYEAYKQYEKNFIMSSNNVFDKPLQFAMWLFAEAKGR